MSYKREINRYGKVKHIVKENDNLVIGIFKPNTDGKPPSPRCQCTINFFGIDFIIYFYRHY